VVHAQQKLNDYFSLITSDHLVVGLGLLWSCLMALAKTSALPLRFTFDFVEDTLARQNKNKKVPLFFCFVLT